MHSYKTICLFTWILVISCQQVIDLEIPDHQPRLVVNGFISPNMSISTVSITSSQQSLSQAVDDSSFHSFPVISDATVKLFANNILVAEYAFNEEFQTYQSHPLIFETKVVYRLEVSAPGFESVWAETQIPDNRAHLTAVRLTGSLSEFGNPLDELRLTLKEGDDTDNLYGILLENDLEFKGTNDPQVTVTSNKKLALFDDSRFIDHSGEVAMNLSSITYSPSYQAYLLSCSKDFYEYQKTLTNQVLSNSSKIFPGSPQEVYSNIAGGYGIFAGFNASKFIFDENENFQHHNPTDIISWTNLNSGETETAIDFKYSTENSFLSAFNMSFRILEVEFFGNKGTRISFYLLNWFNIDSNSPGFRVQVYDHANQSENIRCQEEGLCDYIEVSYDILTDKNVCSKFSFSENFDYYSHAFWSIQSCDTTQRLLAGEFILELSNGDLIEGEFKDLPY